MGVILETELRTLMARDKSVAVLWQDEEEGRTALLAKAADEDVEGFRGPVPIQTAWELGRLWCASVLRLQVIIFDRPDNPYRFESFINVAEPQQLACVRGLVTQETLQLHFFDSRTEHVLTKGIRSRSQQRRQLRELVGRAVQDQARLGERWDFERAKALFLRLTDPCDGSETLGN